MQMRPLSRSEVREVDRRAIDDYGMTGLVLMENAGRGCVETLMALGCRGPVVIACGKGNNGGDGFVMARHLELLGIPVKVLIVGDPANLRGDAAANFAILAKTEIPICRFLPPLDDARFTAELAGAEWIVDALLGTGSRGAPDRDMATAIVRANQASGRKLAVDLPSGLDCDSGVPPVPTFRADHTCTFVAPKLGFANPAARSYLGQIHVIDIGAPRRLLMEIAARKMP